MRLSKRILVLFIALVMIFSSMQGGLLYAFAADEPGIVNDDGNDILAPPEEGDETADVPSETGALEDPSEGTEALLETELTELPEDGEESEPTEETKAAIEPEGEATEEESLEEADPTEPIEPTEETEPTDVTESETENETQKYSLRQSVPRSAIATRTGADPIPACEIPVEGWTGNDNPFIRAFEYLVNNETAYNAYKNSNNWLNPSYTTGSEMTGIGYNLTGCTGTETTAAGLPNVNTFRTGNPRGLCCGSFVAYVFMNYLPNVEGLRVTNMSYVPNLNSIGNVRSWDPSIGHAQMQHDYDPMGGGTSSSNYFMSSTYDRDDVDAVDHSHNHNSSHGGAASCNRSLEWDMATLTAGMQVGDIVVFDRDYLNGGIRTHVAIYMGNGCIMDCGNSAGPQIRSIKSLYAATGNKASKYIRVFRYTAIERDTTFVKEAYNTSGSAVAKSGFGFKFWRRCDNQILYGMTDSNGVLHRTTDTYASNEPTYTNGFLAGFFRNGEHYKILEERKPSNSDVLKDFEILYVDQSGVEHSVIHLSGSDIKTQNGNKYVEFDIPANALPNNYEKLIIRATNGKSADTSISILKRDAVTQQPLAGAVLKLQKWNGSQYVDVTLSTGVTAQWTTTTSAKKFTNPSETWITAGYYRIVEVSAPPGYQSFGYVNFQITNSDLGKTKEIVVDNTPQTTIEILKVDKSTGQPLPGAVLKIQKKSGTSWVDVRWVSNNTVVQWTSTSAAKVFTDPDWLVIGQQYRLFEVTAPDGYEKFSPIEFKISQAGEKKSLRAEDPKIDKKPITVQKVNGADPECLTQLAGNAMYSLEGARFEIYANGVYSETVETKANGTVMSSKQYEVGTSITVKEVEAPQGFVLNSQFSDPPLIVKDNESLNTVIIADIPMLDPQGLAIHKVDSKTERGTGQGNATLQGAVFKIEYYGNENWTGSPLRTWYFETDADGKFEYHVSYLASGYASDALYIAADSSSSPRRYQIPLGTFKVTEVKAPPGYMATTEPLYGMVVVQGEGASASAHATWRSGTNIEEMTGHEAEGDWLLKEKAKGSGLLVVRKYDAETGKIVPQGEASLAGAVFSVINRSTNAVQIEGNDPNGNPWPLAEPGQICCWLVTNAEGYATTGSYIFPMGTYEVKETAAPEGYLLNENWSQTFTVTNSTASFNFTSYLSADPKACPEDVKRGGVQITKVSTALADQTDANAKLEGITYSIYNESENPVVVSGTEYAVGAKVATITLAWDGTAQKWIAKTSANLLPYGSYYIQENCMTGSTTHANQYYLVDSTKIHFQIRVNGETVSKNIANSENRFENQPELYGEIYKGIAEGSEGSLTGWTFDVYKGTTKIGSYTTNETVTIGGVEYGVIAVKLPIGTYTVKEQQKVGWITQPDQTLVVDGHSFADNPATVFFANNEKTKLQIIKQITPGATGSVEGWQFEVKQGSTVIGTFTTNADGVILEDIPAGTYTIHEIPKENWIVQDDQTVTVTDANTIGNPATVTFVNEPMLYGRVYKGIADGSEGTLTGWSFDVYDGATKIGTYETTTVVTIGGVQYGATDVFRLPKPGEYTVKEQPKTGWAAQPDQTLSANWSNTVDTPATVFFANNAKTKLQIIKQLAPGSTGSVEGWQFAVRQGETLLGTFETNADGVILTDIPTGDYTIHEIPKDHWIVQEDQSVEVTDANTITNPATVTFINTPLTSLKIIKTSEDGIIAGISFEIYRNEADCAAGTNVMQTVQTGADGTIQIDDLTAGTYYVKEIVPPQYLPQDVKTVTLTLTNTIDNPATVSFENVLKRGRIEIYKTDTAGHALAGATFLLEYSEDGETWLAVRPATADDHNVGTCPDVAANGTITTGADGKAIFTELIVHGISYRLTETKAPNGYQLLKEPIMVGALTDEDADGIYEYTAQVVNVSVLVMPATGGPGNLALSMMFTILAGAALLTLFTVISRRRKANSANS